MFPAIESASIEGLMFMNEVSGESHMSRQMFIKARSFALVDFASVAASGWLLALHEGGSVAARSALLIAALCRLGGVFAPRCLLREYASLIARMRTATVAVKRTTTITTSHPSIRCRTTIS